MQCVACKCPLPDGTKVCTECSVRQPSESTPSATAPSRAPVQTAPQRRDLTHKLRKLHTFNWHGNCPKCNSSHTFVNARCPHDGSPLVVSFNASRWNPVFYFYLPVWSAQIRCVANCGYAADYVVCNVDNKSITGVRLTFSFSLGRTILHNLSHCLLAAGTCSILIPIVTILMSHIIFANLSIGWLGAIPMLYCLMNFFRFYRNNFIKMWWLFRYRFTFDDVSGAKR